MSSTAVRPLRLSAVILVAMFIAVACSSSAAPTAAPTADATATPVPTAKPTPKPTPTASPAASPTPSLAPSAAELAAVALKIGAPYRLVVNPANTSLTGSISLQVAGKEVHETIAGREIWQGDSAVGLAYILQIEGVPMTQKVFDAGAQGAANNTAGKLTFTTILGHRVGLVTAKAGTFGMYALDDTIVMILGTKPAVTKPLLTSVIKAND